MKKGWQTKTLEEVADSDCALSYGIVQPGDEFVDGLPVVRPTDLTMKVIKLSELKRIDPKLAAGYQRTTLQGGELLLCVRGSTGTISIASSELSGANVTRGIVPIRFKKTLVDTSFGYYLMIADQVQRQIREKTYGAALMQINIRDLRNIVLTFPPLAEQQRIVGLLDEAFEGVATAKANAEKNLQNARALFESHLQSIFAQHGPGWRHDQLDALTDPDTPITYGVVKPGDEGEITFVRGGDLVRGKVRPTQLRTITRAVSDQYRRTLLRGGELLICLVGQPGQVAVAPIELAGANIARQVGLIRLKKMIDAEFVRYFLQSAPGVEALGARESGSVQQVINLGELRQVSVPYPEFTQQRKIVAGLEKFEGETQRLARLYERKLAALEALKKSLLHQAFAGEL